MWRKNRGCYKDLQKKITLFDNIIQNPAERLHFDDNNEYKSCVGGLFTIFVYIGLFYIGFIFWKRIAYHKRPFIHDYI